MAAHGDAILRISSRNLSRNLSRNRPGVCHLGIGTDPAVGNKRDVVDRKRDILGSKGCVKAERASGQYRRVAQRDDKRCDCRASESFSHSRDRRADWNAWAFHGHALADGQRALRHL